jgi:hypothetical protein
VLSLIIGFVVMKAAPRHPQAAGRTLLRVAFILQALVLAAGGGIACLNSIFSEKEQSTFDYQRITRLTPSELALGKLFGAPVLMYFICLWLTPLTMFAAIVARGRPLHVLAAYVVLVVASVAFHTFTLLLSLLAVRGLQLSSILLALLVLSVSSVDFAGDYFRIHSIGPFEAEKFATNTHFTFRSSDGKEFLDDEFADVFFFRPIHHFPVLVGIDLFLGLWFFLGVVRNIKRDPQYYEVYSPLQFLVFTLFLNFLLVGFCNASKATPLNAQALLLTLDMVFFYVLGIALLRNRERMRSLLRAPEQHAANWWNTVWPAPLLSIGAILTGMLIVVGLNYAYSSADNWSLGFAVLRSLVFTVWIVCNIQFLQFMNLRPGKHPLVMAVLYLSIYYFCVSVFLSVLEDFRMLGNMHISYLFMPSAVYLLEPKTWEEGFKLWVVAGFVIQVVLIGLFLYLQKLQIRQLKGYFQQSFRE